MIVFTVIIGPYDNLKPIKESNEAWRYVCITDNEGIEPNGWEIIPVKLLNPPEKLTGVRLQRWVKVIGGIQFFKCDTLYVDGSHEIVKDVTELYQHLTMNIAFKKHPIRNCYIDEGEACKRLKKAANWLIDRQITDYKVQGLPFGYGMFETGIIIRKYNSEVVRLCVLWASEIEKFSHRDQLSVTWVLFKTGIQYDVFDYSEFNKYINIHKHNEQA